METLEQIYDRLCVTPLDINEHLPTLKKYAEDCEHVTEMGVNAVVSTYALMMGKPKKLISYDIIPVEHFGVGREYLTQLAAAHGIDFSFVEADTTNLSIESTDCLFIDTEHNYLQLKIELLMHAARVRKYIILHDTVSFGHTDSNTYGRFHNLPEIDPGDKLKRGLMPAIVQFLEKHPEWEMHEHFTNNNGLSVLKRRVL
jgi:hypothetical protein